MAALQNIRKHSIVLLIAIGVALFAFIIGDFLTSGSTLFQQSQENIASINGKKLNFREYERRIQEMEDVYKIQTGQSSLDEELVNQIRESVYETIVRETLLDEQAKALGISVTSEELFDMINGENVHYLVQQMPFFQNPETGAFDRSVMMNFLRTIQSDDLSSYPAEVQAQIAQMKNFWLFWENNLKYARLEEKISNILLKAVTANSLDAKANFDARQRSVNVAYAFKPYSELPDSTFKVSTADAKKLYKSSIEEFRQEPSRAARYVVVDVLPSQEDNDAVKADIEVLAQKFSTDEDPTAVVNANSDNKYLDCFLANSVYTGTLGEFASNAKVGEVKGPFFEDNNWIMLRKMAEVSKPDSVKVSQIYIADKGESGNHLADSLLNVLKTNKKADFAALAAQYSQDQTAAQGGDMGWFREVDAFAGMGKEFTDACFSAKKNAYVKVASNYGLHIIKVTDMTKAVKKSKIAQLVMPVTPSSKTFSAAYNKLNQVVAANQETESFVKAAREAGYTVQYAPVIRKTDYTIGNVASMRQAVRFVHNNKVGDVSTIFENSNNQYMVVAIESANDGEYRSFESVQSQLARELINKQKAAAIISGLKDAADVKTIAAENGMRNDTIDLLSFSARRIAGLGDEPALLAAVLSAPMNEVSKPVAGNNGVYVFTVFSDVNGTASFDETTEKLAMTANDSYRVMYQAMQAVRDAADVEDSRIRFY